METQLISAERGAWSEESLQVYWSISERETMSSAVSSSSFWMASMLIVFRVL